MISAAAAAGGGADAGGGARLLPPHHHHHPHHRGRPAQPQGAAAAAPAHRPYAPPGEAWRERAALPAGGRPAPADAPVELFLRPAPKPLAPAVRSPKEALAASQVFFNYSRFNGLVSPGAAPNGTRIAPSRPLGKYPSPPNSALPVNLAQPKEDPDDLANPYAQYRLFHHPAFPSFPPYTTFPQQFLIRGFPPTPLSPQDLFAPTTPTVTTSQTFLPPATFSPPSTIVKPPQHVLKGKRTPPSQAQPVPTSPGGNFKVPSGKEGSLKHRILTRPEDVARNTPLDLQKPPEGRKRLQATLSPPPKSPKRTLNNNTLPANFAKGSLIQLANGEYKKIEDMRTEDFVMSAEKSLELRLAESTVVKIEESSTTGMTTIALTYNQRRAQVEVESPPEHPYFVVGRGWASANPDRTQRCFGLRAHRLQVGDVIVSLTPREPRGAATLSGGTTVVTTATGTTVTPKQAASPSPAHQRGHAPAPALSPNRKRRWSAPDQLDEEGEAVGRQRAD